MTSCNAGEASLTLAVTASLCPLGIVSGSRAIRTLNPFAAPHHPEGPKSIVAIDEWTLVILAHRSY